MATQTQERRLAFLATALPPIAWVVVFFLAPLAIVWAYSFGQNAGLTDVDISGTFANYMRALQPLYLGIFVKSIVRRRADDAALPHHRLSGGAGDRLRQREVAGVDAAADHAAVLDQPSDPHLRADRGAAHRGLRQFHARMAVEPGELAHDAGGLAAARRLHAAAAALQQLRRGGRARLRPSALHGAAALCRARPARQIADRSEPRSRRGSSRARCSRSWCRWRCRASSPASSSPSFRRSAPISRPTCSAVPTAR